MTKREFLKELEDRLQMLDEKERKDMIEEYTQHIRIPTPHKVTTV